MFWDDLYGRPTLTATAALQVSIQKKTGRAYYPTGHGGCCSSVIELWAWLPSWAGQDDREPLSPCSRPPPPLGPRSLRPREPPSTRQSLCPQGRCVSRYGWGRFPVWLRPLRGRSWSRRPVPPQKLLRSTKWVAAVVFQIGKMRDLGRGLIRRIRDNLMT